MDQVSKKQKLESEVVNNLFCDFKEEVVVNCNWLPADLWQEIVKYLDQETILAARRVCKTFREHIGM